MNQMETSPLHLAEVSDFAEHTLGTHIKAIREKKGMTREDLAKAMGVTAATVGQIETGEREAPIEDLRKIARALGISVGSLTRLTRNSRMADDPLIMSSFALHGRSHKDEDEEEFAELTTEQRNMLPDSSFAYISPGGKKDSSGKTVPRSRRRLPYLNAQGGLDKARAQAAIAVLNGARGGINIPRAAKFSAWNKIVAAMRKADSKFNPPPRRFWEEASPLDMAESTATIEV